MIRRRLFATVVAATTSSFVSQAQDAAECFVFAARARSSAALDRTAGIAEAVRGLNAHKPAISSPR